MSEFITVAAVIAVVCYVIGRQLVGEALRGKRVVLLPVILTVIGVADLHKNSAPVHPADIACLAASAILAVGIGLVQGRNLRLESRNGALWGQMPTKSLWLWALLVGSRVGITVLAHGVDAKLAESGATILVMLGINRLAQAAVIVARAAAAGIPFAPEKDGKSFLAGITGQAVPTIGHQAATGSAPVGRRTRGTR